MSESRGYKVTMSVGSESWHARRFSQVLVSAVVRESVPTDQAVSHPFLVLGSFYEFMFRRSKNTQKRSVSWVGRSA